MSGISPAPCRASSAERGAEKRSCTTWIEEEKQPEEEVREEVQGEIRGLPLPATPFMFTSVQVRNEAVAGREIKLI